MARQIQIIKGTTAQNEAFTGAEGVLTYDSDKKDIRIHDGTTAGGFEIPSSSVMADYVVYWDSADSTDHSHAKPGVSTPTDNGWYRVYKSGWVEQGGIAPAPQELELVYVTIPVEMQDTSYSVLVTNMTPEKTHSGHYGVTVIYAQSTTQFRIASISSNLLGFAWRLAGFSGTNS